MRRIILLPLLAMTACSSVGATKSPQEDYIATISLATVIIDGATSYATDCARSKPKGHACEAFVLKLEKPVRLLEGAKIEATKVVATKDSRYYDLSQSALQNAINNVQAILMEAKHV